MCVCVCMYTYMVGMQEGNETLGVDETKVCMYVCICACM